MLTGEQLALFNTNGYLVIDQVLDDSDLEPLEREYEALLEQQAQRLFRDGVIDSDYSNDNFAERFAAIVVQYPDLIDRFNISLPL